MSAYGDRLKSERKRLGKTQDEFAAIAGITRNPYSAWEKSATAPDVKQLAAIAAAGADVQYIVTGVRSDMALTPDERELLSGYRTLDVKTKRRMRAFILDGDVPSADIEIHAPGGTVAGRDMTITNNKGRKK